MDQIKIGKFIAECRKKNGLTQAQLAEKLGITDRAVSKWENGKSMPDSSIMLSLCGILNITVNDLLCGEVIQMENYNKETEKALLEMVKQKEQTDRIMLRLEVMIGVLCTVVLLALTMVASLIQMDDRLRIILIAIGAAQILIVSPFLLWIEQTAGYYKCANCGHAYVPTYKSVTFAQHMGRTRRLRCPECGKKSWHKKVINKD